MIENIEIQAALVVLYENAGMSHKEAVSEVMILKENRKALIDMFLWTYKNKPDLEDIWLRTEEWIEKLYPEEDNLDSRQLEIDFGEE